MNPTEKYNTLGEFNSSYYRHNHDGVNSDRLDGRSFKYIQTSKLTTADTSTATSADAAIINNIRTRIVELETLLTNLGFLPK